jgi:hypothetical protein
MDKQAISKTASLIVIVSSILLLALAPFTSSRFKIVNTIAYAILLVGGLYAYYRHGADDKTGSKK